MLRVILRMERGILSKTAGTHYVMFQKHSKNYFFKIYKIFILQIKKL